MNKKVRIGQVGVTGHGSTILGAVQAATTLELVTIFDTKKDEAKRISTKLGIKQARDYAELVGDSSVEAVVLVTPNNMHADQVRQAFDAKKHVFVEKPMAQTVAEARQMISHSQKAGLILMVGHNTRRRWVFRRAKKVIDEKRIGTIVGVEMNVSRPAGLFPDVPAWKADPNVTPLLPMTQLGIHFVDALHYLFGSTVKNVGCVATNAAMSGGARDATAAILQLQSGIPATLSSYYVTPDIYEIRVYGTQGILQCWNSRLKLELLVNGSLKPVMDEDFSSEGSASFVEEMVEFGGCILNGKKPETAGEEGLLALAAIEAMQESLKNHSIVNIENLLRER